MFTKKNKNGKIISSETCYNKNVCNDKNYILLDCKLINGCEVADIYDIENKQMFHIKKLSDDLRIVGFQIIIGACIIQNPDMFKEYLHPRTFKTAQNIPTLFYLFYLFYLLYNFIQINRILLISIV